MMVHAWSMISNLSMLHVCIDSFDDGPPVDDDLSQIIGGSDGGESLPDDSLPPDEDMTLPDDEDSLPPGRCSLFSGREGCNFHLVQTLS